jgi:hypothetical protein
LVSVLLPITSSAWASCSREDLSKRDPKARMDPKKSYIRSCPKPKIPFNPVQTNASFLFRRFSQLKERFLRKAFFAPEVASGPHLGAGGLVAQVEPAPDGARSYVLQSQEPIPAAYRWSSSVAITRLKGQSPRCDTSTLLTEENAFHPKRPSLTTSHLQTI